jgi:hypothetical protein
LPVAERTRSAERQFPAAPWISTPSWLLQEMPEHAGDVRFAKSSRYRAGGPLLVVPLTRDDAEDRHRNGESYVLAARLPDGCLVVLDCEGWDRNDPRHSGTPSGPYGWFDIRLYGSDHRVDASFRENHPPDGALHLQSINVVDQRAWRKIWHCFIFLDTGEASIEDCHDPENRVMTRQELTEADREMCTAPMPDFGEFDGLLSRALAVLRRTGYGEVA